MLDLGTRLRPSSSGIHSHLGVAALSPPSSLLPPPPPSSSSSPSLLLPPLSCLDTCPPSQGTLALPPNHHSQCCCMPSYCPSLLLPQSLEQLHLSCVHRREECYCSYPLSISLLCRRLLLPPLQMKVPCDNLRANNKLTPPLPEFISVELRYGFDAFGGNNSCEPS